MTTIREVAEESGYSTATVSRALNDRGYVNARTKLAIEAAARRVGYHPNRAASSLRGRPSKMVGLLLPTLEIHDLRFAMGPLHDALSGEGYRMILCCHEEDPKAEVDALNYLLAHQVDAIVHVPAGSEAAYDLVRLTRPIPVLEMSRQSASGQIPAVLADIEQGAYELTRHLVELGHTRIGVLLTGRRAPAKARSRAVGVLRALHEGGVDPAGCPILTGSPTAEWGERAATDLLDGVRQERPSAILAANTYLLMGVLGAARKLGLSIPDDLSVVATSAEQWVAFVDPPMTTYDVPEGEIGMLAAQILLSKLRAREGEVPGISGCVTVSGKLVVRGSTGSPKT